MLRQVNSPASDYWGWGGRPASAFLLFRKRAGAETLDKIAHPLPFTPLFVFLGRPPEPAQQGRAGRPLPRQPQAAILPPFFAQSHE